MGCQWEEVVLKDSVKANKINAAIREAVSAYKIAKSDSSLVCHKSTNFNRRTEFKVVSSKNNLLSYYLSTGTYYKGVLHDLNEFSTLNFNLQTAEKVNFDQLFDTTMLPNIDLLIIEKITPNHRFRSADFSELKEQLINKEFNLKQDGLEIFYWYENYPLSILIPFAELKPYVLQNSLLKNFYSNY